MDISFRVLVRVGRGCVWFWSNTVLSFLLLCDIGYVFFYFEFRFFYFVNGYVYICIVLREVLGIVFVVERLVGFRGRLARVFGMFFFGDTCVVFGFFLDSSFRYRYDFRSGEFCV